MGQTMCGVSGEGSPKAISNMEQIQELDFNRNSTYQKLEQYSLTVCKDSEISTNHNNLIQRLLSKSQFHLLFKLKELSTPSQKNHYLQQLNIVSTEMDVVDSLYHHFINQIQNEQSQVPEQVLSVDKIQHIQNLIRVQDIPYEQYSRQYLNGLNLIAKKQVALVVLAGGKSTRFGTQNSESKGVCNLNLPSSMSMFDIIGRKLKTLKDIARRFGVLLGCYNHKQSELFCYQKNLDGELLFRILRTRCPFYSGMYPTTDMKGKILLKDDSNVNLFPCGTGDAILKLYHHKIISRLLEKNYKYIHFIGIDNLLVKPLDPLLIGIAMENRNAITQKCVQLDREETDFYRILSVNDRATIMEPSEIATVIRNRKLLQSKRRMECSPSIDIPLPGDLHESPVFMTNTLIRVDFLDWFHRQTELKFAFESKFRVLKRYVSDVQAVSPFPNSDNNEQKFTIPSSSFPQKYPASQSLFSQHSNNDSTQFSHDKTYNTEHTNLPEPNVLIFEKNIGDLLELTDDVCFVKVNQEEEFAPIIYKSGKHSPEEAALRMSYLHKRWLQFDESELINGEIVEVCPNVSYAGENLDQSIEFFQKQYKSLKFPLYLNTELNKKIKDEAEKREAQLNFVNYSPNNLNENISKKKNHIRQNSDLVSKSFSNLQPLRGSKLFQSYEENQASIQQRSQQDLQQKPFQYGQEQQFQFSWQKSKNSANEQIKQANSHQIL